MSDDNISSDYSASAPPPPPPLGPDAAVPPVPDRAPQAAPVPEPVFEPSPPSASRPVSAVTPTPGMGAGLVVGVALMALVIASFAGLAAGFLGARLGSGGLSVPRPNAGTSRVQVIPSKTQEPAAAAAAAALPAVVYIEVESGASTGTSQGLPDAHPSVPSVGSGSGVGYRNAGGGTLIITNNHVVDGADKVTVRDAEGNSMSAGVVGRDAETDIAVVRVERKLPIIEVGDSSRLIVGQTVVAIGSPFGLEHSVTSGVVSALGRSLPEFDASQADAYPLVDVIQTDAAINPGNSGGALVDREGKLVGINTAIYSSTQTNGGIGFAVPVNTAVRVADQLISGKEVTHPFIGVIGQTIDTATAKKLRLSVSEGAVVMDLSPGSGAQKAGVRVNDVITAVDGGAVRSMDDLILLIRRKNVGDEATLTIVRGKATITLDVVVGDKPANVQGSRPDTSTND